MARVELPSKTSKFRSYNVNDKGDVSLSLWPNCIVIPVYYNAERECTYVGLSRKLSRSITITDIYDVPDEIKVHKDFRYVPFKSPIQDRTRMAYGFLFRLNEEEV